MTGGAKNWPLSTAAARSGPGERPMGGYLSLPPGWRDTPEVMAGWVERARDYVAALPPKQKKPKRAKQGSAG